MDAPPSTITPATHPADARDGAYPVPYRGVPASAPQNVLAWVSLGLAIGFVVFGVLTSIPAIICGHIARSQIRRTGEQGAAAALTGPRAGVRVHRARRARHRPDRALLRRPGGRRGGCQHGVTAGSKHVR